MSSDLRYWGTLILSVLILGGCFYLILHERGDQNQAWVTIGVIVAFHFVQQARDAGAASARSSMSQGATTAIDPGKVVRAEDRV